LKLPEVVSVKPSTVWSGNPENEAESVVNDAESVVNDARL
jgi:hypothetical protein